MTTFERIAEGWGGSPDGHVPGHSYDDVVVRLESRDGTWRAVATEQWGQNQGYDDEGGRRTVAGKTMSDPYAALDSLRYRAEQELEEPARSYFGAAASECLAALPGR